MKFKYALHPKDYAIGQIEKFYTDMAAKGWHLKKHGAWLSKFKQGQPLDMKYRVEVLNPESSGFIAMSEEQKVVFEDCGWEYVDGHGYISVFRASADSDTEEFYIDPAQQADTLKGLRKSMLANAIQLPFTLLILVLLNTMMGENMSAQIYLSWISETAGMVGLILIILALCFESIRGAFHLNRLYRQMKKSIPIDHSPKKQSKLPSVIRYTVAVIGIIAVASGYINASRPMPTTSDGGYVTFADMGIELPRGTDYLGNESQVVYKYTPFAQYWDTYEVLNEETKWLYQDVYKLKNKDKALKTAKALMNTSTFAQSENKFGEMEFAGLEKVYCNSDLELVVINNGYVGYFTSIFTEESRTRLLTTLAEKWK